MRIIDESTHLSPGPNKSSAIQMWVIHMTDNVSTYFQDVICNKQVIMHEITTEKQFVRVSTY